MKNLIGKSMKDTGERLVDFVQENRSQHLLFFFGAVIFAVGWLIYFVFNAPTFIAERHLAWWRIPFIITFQLILFSLAFLLYKPYLSIAQDSQNPSLITQQLKLLKRDYSADSDGDFERYDFTFEREIFVSIDLQYYQNNLIVGEIYQLRILPTSKLVFDIKTLEGELLLHDAEKR